MVLFILPAMTWRYSESSGNFQQYSIRECNQSEVLGNLLIPFHYTFATIHYQHAAIADG
ncbi:MAG: hypothetical protein ABIR06_04605 [Cyclobacteriaceae bacterium]